MSRSDKVAPFEINGVTVQPGTRAKVELPLAQLYTQTPLNVPIHVIHGRRPGPVLLVSAAIHGDELNGVEIIRRLLRHSALRRLSGTVLAVPVVNVFGFIHKTRYLPDRRDLNRCFPGSETGSLGARMAWQFKTQVLDRATHAVDLHTGAIHRANLPQIRADLSNGDTAAMAAAFGVPVVINSVLGEGTLREVAEAQGIPVITYEAGEALRFDESCIRAGVKGVLNVMQYLRMTGSRRTRDPLEPNIARASSWVRAERDGVFLPLVALGAWLRKGQLIGRISSPFGGEDVAIEAPCAGILVGRNNLPLVNEGEALYHIARFEEVREVAQDLEVFTSDIERGPGLAGEPPIV
ncbi:succinylglutamate desuccinylase/aspartoacylase family protein [Alloalcanivorax profundimaris]|uniref:Deacylase n=1 Tax=Alloalcanivorax profundimaris TaxID=2735259 RepID=A0ABS0AQR6_9GAMM|nr:succinylglutamate desuccinylase/aspartoacylase family protein [Alloalcanivorax profundimaris]MBM1144111.1 succinylglutamate desuccinylase/aspartoacylase family protein [Alcanivorax sp. ZXX171]MBU58147.1 succinylglutamate desuccinylase [Alcanivorax sp.]MCQ6261870.1 succinylglutamate desuccinylase/aspartoacylase family protein [Alcanivorax sp. MM125-6]MBF1800964.1 succinylglutamate desuccinylase/aspartoacylase family protein [Alloalcanivorax profundimaris]MBF5056438.1 deacylase [Alloalcanivor